MKITRSLRWRIQLWHGAFLLAVLAGLGFAAWHYEKQKGIQRIDDELGRRVTILFDSLPKREEGRPPPRDEAPDDHRPPREGPPRRGGGGPEIRLPSSRAELFKDSFYYVIFHRDGRVVDRSANAPEDVPLPPPIDEGKPGSGNRTRGDLRERFLFTPPGECLLVGCSTVPEAKALKRHTIGLIAIEGIILILGLGGGWWITSRALRPLDAIRKTAIGVSEGHLDQRIDLPPDDSELGQLATLLNDTFGKLEAAFARQVRFTSDAAHELRTPLSVVISQAQMALRGDRDPAEYREMFEASLRGAKRMQSLTQSLLELARLDNGSATAIRIPCDLAELAAEAISLVSIAAEERDATIIRDLKLTPCVIDPESVLRVIVNLLNNAIEHGIAPITLSTSYADGHVKLTVTDNGPGIEERHLPHLFDRFYRADESRNRKTGGTGLGLAICKAIIDAHGGSLTVSSSPGKGSVFTVTLPAK